jgi:hypothetical protein
LPALSSSAWYSRAASRRWRPAPQKIEDLRTQRQLHGDDVRQSLAQHVLDELGH